MDEVELLVGPVLHLLSDPEDVQGGQGQGHPAVVIPRPRRLGVYDLCEDEIGSMWALIIFLLRLLQGGPGGSATKLGSGGLELTFKYTLARTLTIKSSGGL